MPRPGPDRRRDREHVLTYGLSAVRARVKLADAACGLLGLAAWIAGSLLVLVILDHIVSGGLDRAWRRAGLVGALTASAVVLGWRVIRPLSRRIADMYAARLLERHYPELENALVTAVELRGRRLVRSGVAYGVADRVAQTLARMGFAVPVPWKDVRRSAAGLLIVLSAFGLYSFLSPKAVWPSLMRMLGSDRPAPSRTWVVVRSPAEDVSVLIGEPVTFEAEVGGRIPDAAHVEFSSDGGATWIAGERLPLQMQSPVEGRRGRLWMVTRPGEETRASRDYRIVAGDAVSLTRRLTVRPLPDVASARLRMEFPRYTGLAPRTRPAGDIEVIAGTRVTLHVETTVPARDARLVFRRDGQEVSRMISRDAPEAQSLEASWLAERDQVFFVTFTDRFGAVSRNPIEYRQRVRPDGAPEIRMNSPVGEVVLADGQAYALSAEVGDDFGLSRILLRYAAKGRTDERELSGRATAEPGWQRVATTLRPTELGGGTDADVECWIEVADNRHDSANQPAPQRTIGPVIRLRIDPKRTTPPEPPPTESEDASPDGDAESDNEGSSAGEDQAPPEAARAAADDLREFLDRNRDAIEKLHERMERERREDASGDALRQRTNGKAGEESAESGRGSCEQPEAGDPDDGGQSGRERGSESGRRPARSGDESREQGGGGGALERDGGGDNSKRDDRSDAKGDRDDGKTKQDSGDGRSDERRERGSKPNAGRVPDEEDGGERSDGECDGKQSGGRAKDKPRSGGKPDASGSDKPGDDGPAGENPSDGARSRDASRGSQGERKRSEEDSAADSSSVGSEGSRTREHTKGDADEAKPGSGEKCAGADDRKPSEGGEGSGRAEAGESAGESKPKSGGDGTHAGRRPASGVDSGPPETGDLPAGDEPERHGPDDGRFVEEGATGDRPESLGRTERLVNELERRLRRGGDEADELLEDLGWARARAEQFVREYRRKAAAVGPQLLETERPTRTRQMRSAETDSGGIQRGDRGSRAFGGLAGVDSREAVSEGALRDAEAEVVPPEFREILDEYYRSMAQTAPPK